MKGFKDCYFEKKGQILTLGNELIERKWEYKDGKMFTVSFFDKATKREWAIAQGSIENEFCYEGVFGEFTATGFKIPALKLLSVTSEEIKESRFEKAGLKVIVTLKEPKNKLTIKRNLIIYPEVPAIRSYIELKSDKKFKDDKVLEGRKLNVVDSIPVLAEEFIYTSVEFFNKTDRNYESIMSKRVLAYSGDDKLPFTGSLLIQEESVKLYGLYYLKESMPFQDQRPETFCNFQIGPKNAGIMGWGFDQKEIKSDRFRKSYGSVIGVFNEGIESAYSSVRKYNNSRFNVNRKRNPVIIANPWGDEKWKDNLSEKFVLKEIEAAAKVGATHYQIEEGWEDCKNADPKKYWDIKTDILPNKFELFTKRAKELGINLALWYAPDQDRHRKIDIEIKMLTEMYKKYGVTAIKTDWVNLRDKDAEENLEKIYRTIDSLDDNMIFSMDNTSLYGRRFTYYFMQEYGAYFFQNRYIATPDFDFWFFYFPYKTLRNLWAIANYVPLQKIHVEVPNLERRKEEYFREGAVSPVHYSFEYCFAISMFANPIIWGQPSDLSPSAVGKLRKMTDLYKKYNQDIASGDIYALGDEPTGYSWTGFQSNNEKNKTGYLLIFREANESSEYRILPKFLNDKDLNLQSISDDSKEININKYDGKGIVVSLLEKNSFRLYKYQLKM
ncbi:MAG: hypothetical protein A3J83_01850 [Elusimicrobia bacterium RIFOXYA2_FULL_40_6]|nr:MAG: hypothetical protein A3J83_01850 [Elusimicrobia bacterium RIFOXYA2_FULL_40_6]